MLILNNLVIVDNYDSFTYNLVHYLEPIVDRIFVLRNDEIDHTIIKECSHIVLSPGPGLPNEANDLMDVIDQYKFSHSILGVCLGHQAIAQYFGAELLNMERVKHGVKSTIKVKDYQCLFNNLPSSFFIGHYHSWLIKKLPSSLICTGVGDQDQIMSFRHISLNIYGIQFHPESILTSHGRQILKNWIELQSIK